MAERIAIITGGCGDIGKTIAKRFLEEGIKIALIDKSSAKCKEAAQLFEKESKNLLIICADVSKYDLAHENMEKVEKALGAPTILINAAGIRKDATIMNMTEEEFDSVIAVNLKGTFNYIKAIAPIFKKEISGKIVNIASINGLRGKFGQANYASSKGGVIALTKTAAIELGKYNVNVNAVAPGMIETDFLKGLNQAMINKAVSESLLGRLGLAEDIAEIVTFLVSDKARHITGQVIRVDGGQYT